MVSSAIRPQANSTGSKEPISSEHLKREDEQSKKCTIDGNSSLFARVFEFAAKLLLGVIVAAAILGAVVYSPFFIIAAVVVAAPCCCYAGVRF